MVRSSERTIAVASMREIGAGPRIVGIRASDRTHIVLEPLDLMARLAALVRHRERISRSIAACCAAFHWEAPTPFAGFLLDR